MHLLRVFVFVSLLSSFALGQELSRPEKIQKINDLRSQIGALEKDIMLPDAKDSAAASRQGFNAIRLLPREKYDGVLATRGGGSYYSFYRKNQEYGRGSDIGLEQGNLKVGFAGYDFGFLRDLGEASIADIDRNSPEAFFLVSYKPPVNDAEIRNEQRRSHEYDANGVVYKSYLPAVVGHSYLLRSINYDSSDVLVTFNIVRKDPDGSLIIFWKNIENFAKPNVVRNDVAEK